MPPELAVKKERSGSFLFVGRLVLDKGVDILLKALKEMGPDTHFRLLVAGEGPAKRGLQELSQRLGLESQVKFLGHVAPAELRHLYARASAVVLPSLVEEGLGRSLVEGALHGCALVGSDHGGIRDVIRHGVSGLLVEPGDSESLAKALVRIARDHELAAQLGVGAKATAERMLLDRRIGLDSLQRLVKEVCGA